MENKSEKSKVKQMTEIYAALVNKEPEAHVNRLQSETGITNQDMQKFCFSQQPNDNYWNSPAYHGVSYYMRKQLTEDTIVDNAMPNLKTIQEQIIKLEMASRGINESKTEFNSLSPEQQAKLNLLKTFVETTRKSVSLSDPAKTIVNGLAECILNNTATDTIERQIKTTKGLSTDKKPLIELLSVVKKWLNPEQSKSSALFKDRKLTLDEKICRELEKLGTPKGKKEKAQQDILETAQRFLKDKKPEDHEALVTQQAEYVKKHVWLGKSATNDIVGEALNTQAAIQYRR